MNLLTQTLAKIQPLDQTAMQQVQAALTKKFVRQNDWGLLSDILYKYAGITGQTNFTIPKKCSIIACADHGVSVMKISAYPPETTVQMTRNYLIAQGAVANALANFSQSTLEVVDMGIAADVSNIPKLLHKKIALGTQNCATGPAMSYSQAIQSIETGIAIVNKLTAAGYSCFLPGEMGIANTTSSAAIVAALCNLSPEQATGRGTNISDERLLVKIAIVRQALAVNKPNSNDAIDVLAKVGGFELGCITGIIIGAAANRACVVLDGFNTSAAALIAAKLCPLSRDYLLASHLAAEQAHGTALAKLQAKPYMNLEFRLGEATGSSIAVKLLDGAIKIFNELQNPALDYPFPVKHGHLHSFTLPELHKYLTKIAPLDAAAQANCQLFIDNLTKPLHSLGALESLAVQIAGITRQRKPLMANKYFIACSASKQPTIHQPLTALVNQVQAKLNRLTLPNGSSPYEPLSFMKLGIDYITASLPHNSAVSFLLLDKASVTAAQKITSALQLDPNQPLLQLLIQYPAPELTAVMGMILAAANQRCLIIADNDLSQAAASLTCQFAPSIKPFIFVPEYSANCCGAMLRKQLNRPDHFMLNLQLTGANAWCGFTLVDAAMHMLHDMKTFEEAAVAVANDGPGAARQSIK